MKTVRRFLGLWVPVAIMFLLAGSGQIAAADELRDIIAKGTIRVGTLIDLPPFGMTDASHNPIGFDIDLAHMFADDLGVKLELVPVTGGNRLPYLVSNKVDVIIGAFGATPERAKQIAFSSAYSSNLQGVYGAPDIKVSSAAELGSYRVAVARGTTQDLSLSKFNPNAQLIRFEDEATAAAAYLSGQTDLWGAPDLVYDDVMKKNPDRKIEQKFAIRYATNHIGIRQGQPELLRWIDTFVFYHKITGDLEGLYQKWLHKKMPNLPSM